MVGRRGTGKSALAYKLEKFWEKAQKTAVIHLAAEEDQIIGIRPLVALFGNDFKLIRSATRIAWRYAFLMEIAERLSKDYKYKKLENTAILDKHLSKWRTSRYGFCAKLKNKLRDVVDPSSSPEERVSDMVHRLELREIETEVEVALQKIQLSIVILVDRLDEGYEPDPTGIGLINGLVHAVIDVNTKLDNVRTIIFLRDNIFRAVSKSDPDFSRNIEGQVLRLHWDEYGLFNLVVNRLK
ncbi:MAG: ATP-binding protein, partial [Sulfuricaulis sp.]|uniref:P-loop ATPase, Sll1717 family n=1 Tax=Sulfuricaulis sp. TaxID=2003553 RepID=UPI003C544579